MGRHAITVLYVLAVVAVIVGVDVRSNERSGSAHSKPSIPRPCSNWAPPWPRRQTAAWQLHHCLDTRRLYNEHLA
jgi:hypothetical protein